MSSNFFSDNEDLKFQLSQVPWDKLVPVVEKLAQDEDRFTDAKEAEAFYKDVLENLGGYIAQEIAPHTKELDEQHPVLKDGEVTEPARMEKIMKGLSELGAMALALPRSAGGLNAPLLVGSAVQEMLSRADVSVMSHFGFHAGIAQALMMWSLEEGSATIEDGRVVKTRFHEQVEKMANGGEWGAMVLTEPGAGSDLGQIRSKAVLGDDGKWRISGQKIYITSGHGQHHIVIARSEPEDTHPGLKGLSLYYVPHEVERDGKTVRNFEIGGIEHKMGQHSAVAATINYEDSEGELIGTRGHGFLGMLLLMNNARIAVGFESLGLMETAYRQAAQFAEERVTMGKPISKHEMIADYLDEMDVTIRGLRAITVDAAFNEEMSSRLRGMMKVDVPKSDDERREREREIRRYKRRARYLTPLIKYIGGEESVRFARMNMQILGGLGYIVETGAEKLLRDALVIPVYEGTSQIQALMALKDNLQQVMRNPGRAFGEMATARIDAVRARDPLDRGLAKLRVHTLSAMQSIMTRIAADKLGDLGGRPVAEWRSAVFKEWNPKEDFSFGLLHAERFCRLLCYEAVAETLVRQAKAVRGTEHEDERREIAERWMERAEPRARGILIEIEATRGSVFERLFRRRRPKTVDDNGGKKVKKVSKKKSKAKKAGAKKSAA